MDIPSFHPYHDELSAAGALCEQCDVATVEIVVTSLTRNDTDRLCGKCGIIMFVSIAQQAVQDAPAE